MWTYTEHVAPISNNEVFFFKLETAYRSFTNIKGRDATLRVLQTEGPGESPRIIYLLFYLQKTWL
jgi:hypothetical protein